MIDDLRYPVGKLSLRRNLTPADRQRLIAEKSTVFGFIDGRGGVAGGIIRRDFPGMLGNMSAGLLPAVRPSSITGQE